MPITVVQDRFALFVFALLSSGISVGISFEMRQSANRLYILCTTGLANSTKKSMLNANKCDTEDTEQLVPFCSVVQP